jgi:hypothetical protein
MPKVVRRITFWSGTLAVIAGPFLEACRGQGIRAWRKRERMPKVVRRITFWSGTLAVIAGLYLALTGWPAGRRSRSGRQIGLVRPGEPQALDLILERAVLDQARRLDAAANGVRREARRGIGGVGIRAHQLPGARPLQLAALEDQAVDALATSAPSQRAGAASGRSRSLCSGRASPSPGAVPLRRGAGPGSSATT